MRAHYAIPSEALLRKNARCLLSGARGLHCLRYSSSLVSAADELHDIQIS